MEQEWTICLCVMATYGLKDRRILLKYLCLWALVATTKVCFYVKFICVLPVDKHCTIWGVLWNAEVGLLILDLRASKQVSCQIHITATLCLEELYGTFCT